MPRFEDQENMDDEEMELVLNAIEYIKGLNHTKIEYQKNSPRRIFVNGRILEQNLDVYHLV